MGRARRAARRSHRSHAAGRACDRAWRGTLAQRLRLVGTVAGDEQHRDRRAARPRAPRRSPLPSARLTSTRTRSIACPSVEQRDRIGDAVDRRDDLEPVVGQQMLGVERDQRLVLDDQEPDDPSLLLAEHHRPLRATHFVSIAKRPNRGIGRKYFCTPAVQASYAARHVDVPPPNRRQRIAKLLARAGVASRREIERMIAEGRVALGGIAIDTPATLLASLDGVTVDGQPVAAPEAARLFLFHKPAGVLTAERDFSGRPTIYDRAAQGPAATGAGRPARSEYRGAAAADHRWRAEAPARAALDRGRARLSRARLRPGDAAAAGGADRWRRDRRRPLRLDRREHRTADRRQRLDRDDPDRGQEPRGPPRARASRAAGQPPDPHPLRPVRARRPARGRDRRGAAKRT